jgi:hypothetical protein
MPSFFADFLKKCDLRGKRIIPFSTSGRTDIKRTLKKLKQVCPETNIIYPYNYGRMIKDNYVDWMNKIHSMYKKSPYAEPALE